MSERIWRDGSSTVILKGPEHQGREKATVRSPVNPPVPAGRADESRLILPLQSCVQIEPVRHLTSSGTRPCRIWSPTVKRSLIACPNLSLDRTIRVDHVALGSVHRSIESDVRGGGKGVNVARALRCMGREALVAGFAAGRTGHAVMGLLEDEGIDVVETKVNGETRSCLTVLSEEPPTVFNETGPQIDETSWNRYESSLIQRMNEAGLFVFSGSLPPGAPKDCAARLIERARAAGRMTICDTSREYLGAAIEAGPDILKPNLSEALALLGEETAESIDAPENAIERAREAAIKLRYADREQ